MTTDLTSGGDGTTTPFTICTLDQLESIATNIVTDSNSNFELMDDIDATVTSTWDSGAGWTPIGNQTNKFTGIFNGNGHIITGLYSNRPTTSFVGLFGYLSAAAINDITLENVSIVGMSYVGGLVGRGDNSLSVMNSSVTGTISGTPIGGMEGTTIGGLIGLSSSLSSVEASFASVTVFGRYNVGGLVGSNFHSSIKNSYSTGVVTADNGLNNDVSAGGLVGRGEHASGSVLNSYSTANVSGEGGRAVGGLVGNLVGFLMPDNRIDNSFATGNIINCSGMCGGLVGYNQDFSLTNNYQLEIIDSYNYVTTGQLELLSAASDVFSSGHAVYTGTPIWDFTNIWNAPSGGYPTLK